MDNRYDMALSSASDSTSSSYFGIKRFIEKTKTNEESIAENNDENFELIPGTYMTDEVDKFSLSSQTHYFHFHVSVFRRKREQI